MRTTREHLLAVAIVVVLGITLSGGGWAAPSPFTWCIACTSHGVADGILNIALFMPLGILSGASPRSGSLRHKWWVVVLGAAALSGGIETLQRFIPGRYAGLSDIVFNTTGTALGLLVERSASFWLRPNPANVWRRWVWVTALSIGALGGAAYLLGPAQLSGADLSKHSALTIDSLFRGQTTLGLRTTRFGDRPYTFGWLATKEPTGPYLFFLAQAGDDVRLSYAARGRRLRFDEPDAYWLRNAFGSRAPTDTVNVRVWYGRRGWCLWTDGIDGSTECTLGPTLGRGWAALNYPNRIGDRLAKTLDGVWIALCLLPIALWVPPGNRALAPAIVVATMGGMPLLLRVSAAPPAQWGAACASLVAGACFRRMGPKWRRTPRLGG